jgi:C1A family cysteine protease
MNQTNEGLGLGWLPDYPDFRDFTPQKKTTPPAGEERDVPTLLAQLDCEQPASKLPATMDLRVGFPPIEHQLDIGSCTANAGVGLLEYFERGASGRSVDASRLFLYKATRNLMGQTGDTGAFLRVTMQAMVLFGIPPEEYWPYNVADFDAEPSPFCYAFAQNYRAIQYYRLDPPEESDLEAVLARIKTNVAAKLPAMFGFTVYSSYEQAKVAGGAIPMLFGNERRVGGHAVIACGYDDAKEIQNAARGAKPTVGALLIRNSWGADWGDGGYGWLPYEYVLRGLARDWWSVIKSSWVDTGVFGLGD